MATYDSAFKTEHAAAFAALYEGGVVRILDGATVLATISVPVGAHTAGTAGVQELASNLSATITASGTADGYEADTAGGATATGSVSATGGGGDMILDDTSLVENGTATITSWDITVP
jgi:hypothetical protein